MTRLFSRLVGSTLYEVDKTKKEEGRKMAVYPSIINKECQTIFTIAMKEEIWGKCEVMPFPQKFLSTKSM